MDSNPPSFGLAKKEKQKPSPFFRRPRLFFSHFVFLSDFDKKYVCSAIDFDKENVCLPISIRLDVAA